MNMTKKEKTKTSKFLSLVLRHKPEVIGLILDENGWAKVEDLIQKANSNHTELSIETLEHVVESNNKRRFSFNEDKTKIRANQGHSIKVDLALSPQIPPETLYHGTGEKYVSSIEETGLIKKSRNHVHLSFDKATAFQVGQRHGKPVIFEIDSATMSKEGFDFFISENGVWLTESVPTRFLKKINGG